MYFGLQRAILGGRGGPSAPSTSLELLLRSDVALDADNLQAVDASAVKTWSDQSGNGRDASQATSGSRAAYVAADAAIGNMPALDFDGGDFFRGTLGAGTWTDATLYVLWKIDAAGTMAAFDNSDTDSTNRGLQLFQEAPSEIARANTGVLGASYAFSATTWKLHIVRLDGAADTLDLYEREVLKNTYGGATAAIPRTNYTIAALYESGALYLLNGRMAEVRLYSVAHDATERDQAIAYFADRYGI